MSDGAKVPRHDNPKNDEARKTYIAPRLTEHGDVTQLTQNIGLSGPDALLGSGL